MKMGIPLILSGIVEIAVTSSLEDFMLKSGVPASTVNLLPYVGVALFFIGLLSIFMGRRGEE